MTTAQITLGPSPTEHFPYFPQGGRPLCDSAYLAGRCAHFLSMLSSCKLGRSVKVKRPPKRYGSLEMLRCVKCYSCSWLDEQILQPRFFFNRINLHERLCLGPTILTKHSHHLRTSLDSRLSKVISDCSYGGTNRQRDLRVSYSMVSVYVSVSVFFVFEFYGAQDILN